MNRIRSWFRRLIWGAREAEPTLLEKSEIERLVSEIALLKSEIALVRTNADYEAKTILEKRLRSQLEPIVDPLSHLISLGDRASSQAFELSVVLQLIANLRAGLEVSAICPTEIAGAEVPFDEALHHVTRGNPKETELVKVNSVGFTFMGECLRKANVVEIS